MEDVLCKTSSAETLNEIKSLNIDNEGSYSSETQIFSEETLPVSEENLKINVAEEKDQEMNDYNVSRPLSDCDSPKMSDSAVQKTISPTLIGSAIKVMKNFFSPDKTKSKSASVLSSINHPKSASGSPRSSIIIPGKTGLFLLEPETEIHNFQCTPEENLKSPLPINELGHIQGPLIHDPFNSTDDSFLTTVSLIDESFHSAVTHLDEHGDTLKNGVNLMENYINNSRNADLANSFNDSFEINETCLENTTLKNNSFTSEKNGSVQSLENLSIVPLGDGNYCLDDPKKVSLAKTQDEIPKENFCNSVLQANGFLKVPVSSNLQKPDCEEDFSSTTKIYSDSEEMAHLYFSKSFQVPSPSNYIEVYENGFNPNTMEEKKECDNCLNKVRVKENETECESSSDEQDGLLENCISTTTVVLSTVDSVDLNNMLISLKADESATNTSSLTSLEGDDGAFPSENVAENSTLRKPELLLNIKQISEVCSASAKNLFSFTEEKRSCMSEGNSPINKTENCKIKLNKSDEFISRRVLNESPNRKRQLKEKKASVDFSLMKNSEAQEVAKELPDDCNVEGIQEFKNHNLSEIDNSKLELYTNKSESVPIVSQQSYTILSTHDTSLNRPVIEYLNISGELEKQTFQTNHSNQTQSPEKTKGKKFLMNNLNGSFGAECLLRSHQPKQSTPLQEENNESPKKIFARSPSKFYSSQSQEISEDNEVDALGKNTEISFINETSTILSPVYCNNEDKFPLSVSVENETGKCLHDSDPGNTKILSTEDSNEQIPKTGNDLGISNSEVLDGTLPVVHNANQTFDVKRFSSDFSRQNQTFDKNSYSPECNTRNPLDSQLSSSEPEINLTYDVHPDLSKSDKTFSKKLELHEDDPTNKTFVKLVGDDQLNQTYDKKAESSEQSKLNERFCKTPESSLPYGTAQNVNEVLDISVSGERNETFVKCANFVDKCIENRTKELNDPLESSEKTEAVVSFVRPESDSKACNTVLEGNKIYPKSDSDNQSLESLSCKNNINFEVTSNDFNESFVTTKSSDTSLVCSDLSIVFNNEEELVGNRSIDDLSAKVGKINLNKNSEQVFEKKLIERDILSKNDPDQVKEKSLYSIKEEKFSCDFNLTEPIQEQVSSKEFEDMHSVDTSSIKLSHNILRASEEFDKSFHENLTSVGLKPTENEMTFNQPVSTLSPQSLDFLNSIRGKSTGRDLSRESLYVKFDPLVQPSANSLIDFTKEAEAVTTVSTSPPNPHSSSICEQLLTISPQKKPDDIVPPLTPLSNKAKTDLNDDKIEKLKELQNEIYFLKNLYAERERANKVKMENYESQITQLTGVRCMLEDKLKESNEREKSLVKKLKEHTQSIGKLEVVMEEYVNVISKLSTELETVKSENSKQIETLSLEKDSYMTHLQNTEAAFTDVHAKYEKSKKTIASLKTNETMYRNTIAEQAQKLEDLKLKAKEAQENALIGFKKIQEELNEAKSSHTHETARLRAQLRKTELKLEALQEALDQKVKENQQLTAICDELIEGKK